MNDNKELLNLQHIPIQQPRAGTPGEGIYLKLWQEYMQADDERLGNILFSHRWETSQRDASICASFMVFMGCNGGRCLHLEGDRLHEHRGINLVRAYSAAWAEQNGRCRGVNSGLRTIEYMLAERHPIATDGRERGKVVEHWVPELTMRDIDVVECMVEWWAGTDARKMREIAEPMIKAPSEKAQSGLFGGVEGAQPSA